MNKFIIAMLIAVFSIGIAQGQMLSSFPLRSPPKEVENKRLCDSG